MKYFLIILLSLLPFGFCVAQVDTSRQIRTEREIGDTVIDSSILPTDTIAGKLDSTVAIPVNPGKQERPIDSFYLKLLDNPYLKMTEPPAYLIIKERQREDKDEIFYLLAGLMLFLAFIKVVFPKYFANVFRLFFQPSFRQKQTREQLVQGALPSLLLNLFFILSGGIFIALLVNYYQLVDISFWLLFLYGSLLLMILYVFKYLFLTFAGWVFNVKQAAETYIFIVYLINKILGVLLIPFTMLIAFSKPQIIDVSITISIILITLLFFYRYVVSFTPVRREVKVSFLHFFFYVFAFEITPLLLIYKTLINFLDKSL